MNSTTLRAVSLLLLVGCSSASFAQFTVSGTVFVDDGSTVSAANADIQMQVLTPSLDFVTNADIGVDGGWSVDVAAGDYLIAATPSSPGAYQQYVAEFTDGTRLGYNSEFNLFSIGIESLTIAPFTVSGNVADVDITLEQGVTIEGTLTDENTGAPLTGGVVTANTPSFDLEVSYGFVRADGTYFVAAFPAEEYLTFHSGFDVGYGREIGGVNKCLRDGPGGCDTAVAASTPQLPAAGDQVMLDLDLVRRIAVSGSVTDELGNPLQNVRVSLRVADDDFIAAEAWTDGNGDWSVGNVAPGSYYVTTRGEDVGFGGQIFNAGGNNACPQETCDFATEGSRVENFDGLDKSGIDFSLSPAQQFTLTGSIQDAGGNGIGGKIALRKPNGEFVADVFVNGDGSPTTSFPIPAGRYVAYAGDAPGFEFELWTGGEPNLACPNLSCDFGLASLVDMSAGDVSGIDFVLEPIVGGGALSGNIVEAADGVTPVEFVSIAVVNAAGEFITGAATDQSGNFLTQPLSDGDVYLRLENDAPRGLAPEFWNGGEPLNTVCVPFDLCFDTANGSPITIAGGDVTGLDFQLELPMGGQVTGTFEDLDFGFPLAELNVELLDGNGNYVNNLPTDGTGTYVFSGLSDGDYKVFVSGPTEGYPQFLVGDGSCSGGCDQFTGGTVFTVSGGNVVDVGPQQVPYEGGPRITGIVTRSVDGTPVVSRLAFVDVAAYDPSGNFVGSSATDLSGRFQIIPPGGAGDFALVTNHDQAFFNLVNEIFDNVSCINCDPNDPGRTLVNVPDTGAQTAIADFALDSGRTISGTVTAVSDGLPIADITVCTEPESVPDYSVSRCENTDANGNYTITGLIAGNDYIVWTFNNGQPFIDEVYNDRKDFDFSQGDPVDISVGDASGIDFALDAGGFLSGAIQDEFGNPLNDFGAVQIFVADAAGNVVWQGNNGDSTWTSQTLVAGDYFAYAQGEGFGVTSEVWNNVSCPNLTCDITAVGTPITITGGEVGGIDFTLAPAQQFTITGSIRDVAGNAIGGQLLILNAATGEQVWEVFTDGNGNGTAGPIPAGQYIVLAGRRFSDPGFVEELWDGGEPNNLPCPVFDCNIFGGTVVDLTSGDVTGIDFVLDPIVSGGRLSGTVVDDLGNPVAGVSLSVLTAFGYPVQDLSTDQSGGFQTPPLADGNVYLRVENDAPGGLAGELWNGGEPNNTPCVPFDVCFDLANGQPITIAGADLPNLDFQLEIPAGGRIVGVVEDADFFFPLAGQGVALFDSFGGFVANTQTGPDGSFVFAGLADGDFKVFVDGPSQGYEPTLFGFGACNGCDLASNGSVVTVSGGAINDIGPISSQYVGGPRLTGFLTRSDTGAPLLNNANSFAGVNVYDAGGGFLQGLGTDRGGRYQVELAPGDYQVHTFNNQGLIDEVFDNIQCAGGCGPNDPSASLVTVPGTGAVTGFADFALDLGRTISGTITATADGLPIADITVCTEPESVPDYSVSQCTSTDSNGNYTVGGLIAASDYIVWTVNNGQPFIDEVYNDRKDFDFTLGDRVDISVGDASGIDFALDPAASINGTITATTGGAPIEGVLVDLLDTACNIVIRTQTDAAGNYSASGFGQGDFYVHARGAFEGFVSELYPDLPRVAACPEPLDEGTLLSVAVGQTVTGIDFQLEDGASISGVVSDINGPLAPGAARARIYSVDGTQLLVGRSGFFNGDFGEPPNGYLIRGLPAGDYKVVLTGSALSPPGLIDELYDNVPCPRNSCPPGSGVTISLAPAEDRTGIDAVLETGTRISGRITDEQGNPISGLIAIYNDAGLYAGFAASDANGDYITDMGFPAGTYYASNQVNINGPQPVDGGYLPMLWNNVFCDGDCDPLLGDPITVDGTSPQTGIDFVFSFGRTIAGTITATDTGLPIQGVGVCAEREPEPDFSTSVCVETDASGNYLLENLFPAADYVVYTQNFNGLAFIDEVFNDRKDFDFSQGDLVDVSSANAGGIDFALDSTASISGLITAAVDGSPLQGASVFIYDASCNFVASGQADAAGNYLVPVFGDGEYYAFARAASGNFVPELFPNLQRLTPCDLDPITDGSPLFISGTQAVTGIDFQFEAGASISGFVSDASGVLPQFGAQVRLYDTNGTQFTALFNDQPDNSYLLQGLPAGDYNVVLSGGVGTSGLIDERWDNVPCPRNSCPLGLGDVITLAPGEVRTGIDAVLDTGSVLSGRLFDEQGNPLPNTQIAIYTDQGVYAAFATSDANGDFATRNGLPAGDYLISNQFAINSPTPVPAGFIPTAFPGIACGDPCDFQLGSPVTVDGVNPTTGVDMTILSTRTISGTVRAEDTLAPIADVNVCLGNQAEANFGFQQCQWTDAQGQFAFSDLQARTDFIVGVENTNGQPFFTELFDNADCCDLNLGTPIETFSGSQDITMDLARSATISGTVVESGSLAPIQGVPVDVIDASCNLIAVGVTDEFGNYTASGFTGGTYYVHANARFANYVGELFPDIKRVDPCFPDPITDGAPITVTGTQNIGGTDFQLDRGATISGFVSDANGVLPQFRAQARLYALDGTQLFVAFNDRPDGSYRLQGLQAGDYNVVLSGSGLGTGLIDEIFDDIACPRNSCPPGTGVTISLAPGQDRTGISAELELGSQISGRLTDGAGNPLPNTLVAVYNEVGEYAGFASSDANGDYTTSTGFPAGDYLVSNQFAINQPTPVEGGFLPVVWPDVACGEPCDFLLGDPITVDGVNPVTGIDLVFQTGSSIAGVVTGDGVPVSGVEVRLLDAADGSLIRSTNSAADGSYAFEGIGADDYLLRTSNGLGLDDQLYAGISCNPFCDPLSGTPVLVAPDTDVTGIDFPLTSTPQIVGTVTDDTGAPAGGVRVEAYNSLGALIASTSSASDGSFEIGNLFAGTFYVRTRNTLGLIDALADGLFCEPGCNPVLQGTPIGVGSSGDFPAGGLTMQLGDASGLFGRVTGSGAGLSSVSVEVYTPTGVLAASQTTDDQGNYAIDGLSAGSYHVVTRNSQGFIDEGATGQACPSSCAPTTTTPISVAVSQQQQLDFALLPGAVVSGRVTDQASGALPSVEVTVYTDTGVEVASAITDASGNYSIRSLLPDDYVAATTSNPHGLRNRLYDDLPCDAGCNVLAGTLITLGSGAQANGIDFVLPNGKSISGVLTRTSGNPLGGVRVAAFDAAGTEVASARSGPSGAFTITGLPDGVYQLRTFNTIGLVDQSIGGDECTPLDCDLALATSFDVTGASQTGADATLRTGQVLTGVATDENNNPIFSGEAQLYSEQAELLKTAPISNGSFTFNGLAAGTYYAVVTNDLGLVDQAWTGPGVPSLDCPGGSCLSCLVTSSCQAPPNGPAPIVLVDPPRRSAGGPRGGGSDLQFRLPPGEPIAGTITNAQGAPIPGARIYFFSADGANAGTATSDGLGQFQTDAAFSAGSWVAATKRAGQPGVIGFINELFDDIPCGTECDPLNGDVFSTPTPPLIDFQLDRVQTEQIFSSGFEF